MLALAIGFKPHCDTQIEASEWDGASYEKVTGAPASRPQFNPVVVPCVGQVFGMVTLPSSRPFALRLARTAFFLMRVTSSSS